MRIAFTKMHGAGNDFVMIENRSGALRLSPEQIDALCHRRFGVGADGVLLLEKPEDPATQDARMVYSTPTVRARTCAATARGASRRLRSRMVWARRNACGFSPTPA
jgi:diaminopimelate epimerase